MFDPQTTPSWHSSLESQSPSFSPQGISEWQKFQSPTVGWWQQSTVVEVVVDDWGTQQSSVESNSNWDGQLLLPHIKPALHWLSLSQSPWSSSQG